MKVDNGPDWRAEKTVLVKVIRPEDDDDYYYNYGEDDEVPSRSQEGLSTTEGAPYGGLVAPPPGGNPVTARFVLAEGGQDVILECHDHDIRDPDAIEWRKEGSGASIGRGNQLKLIRVDRWDSGLYYCVAETGSTANEFRVDVKHTAPSVSTDHNLRLPFPASERRRDPSEHVVFKKVGEPAILRCKVNTLIHF